MLACHVFNYLNYNKIMFCRCVCVCVCVYLIVKFSEPVLSHRTEPQDIHSSVPNMPGNNAGHNSPKTTAVPSKHPFESLSGIQNMTPL